MPHLLINSLPAWMYQPQSGVVQSISLQHRPKGPDAPIALWRCLTTLSLQNSPERADDGCMNCQVFAKQKPKAQKWHGCHNSWSFAKQNSARSNCVAV
jgi:hypothetical protein